MPKVEVVVDTQDYEGPHDCARDAGLLPNEETGVSMG